MKPRQDLGHFDLATMYPDMADRLLDVMTGFANMRTGVVLRKGQVCRMNLRTKTECEFTLSHDLEYVRNFNPTIINADHSKILNLLLDPTYVGKMIMPGTFVVADKKNDKFFIFSTPLGILVSQNAYGELVLHIVASNCLARGGSAEIKLQLGTVLHRAKHGNKLVYEPARRQRVVRTLLGTSSEADCNFLRKDYSRYKSSSHFAVRGPLFFSPPFKATLVDGSEADGVYAATSMRCFGGKDLYDYVCDDIAGKNEFSLIDRFDLPLELLLKADQQVHARKLKHRDLKLENVMGEKLASGWSLNILDFTETLPMHLQDGRNCGTAVYWPKEMFEFKSSQATDIHMLAIGIGLIWRSTVATNAEGGAHPDHFEAAKLVKLAREKNNWVLDWDLFHGIDGLDDGLKNRIKDLLVQMTSVDPADRPDIKTCIDIYEEIYIDYRFQLLSGPAKVAARMGVTEAKTCRAELAIYATMPIRDFASAKRLVEIIDKSVNAIPDQPICIKEFIKSSKIRAISSARTKKDIIANVTSCVEGLQNAMALLDDLSANIQGYCEMTGAEIPDLGKLISQIEIFKQKIFTAPLDIDQFGALIAKALRKHQKLTEDFTELQKLQPANERLKLK